MAEVSLPQHPYAMSSRSVDSMGTDVFLSPSQPPSAPEPNPPFVFPMRSSQYDSPGAPVEIPQIEGATISSRRSGNRSRPQRISLNSLPAFEFHPSTANSSSTTSGSSTSSPTRSIPISGRSSGHRRGGSEFIGGDGTADGPGLMSTSPTKGEGVLPSPAGARHGPPGGRRGHAHRRSGAISHHDLSAILKPAHEANPRSGSAPTTPSDPNGNEQFFPNSDKSASQPSLIPSGSPSLTSTIRRESSTSTGQPRPRVGFSETVEFIPRPLSTISSETSSSMSTIRAAHSVTNSISSVVSAGTYSPPSAKKPVAIFEAPFEEEASTGRPRSAGEVSRSFSDRKTPRQHRSLDMGRSRSGESCYIPIDSNISSFEKDQDLWLQHEPPPDDDDVSPFTTTPQEPVTAYDFPQLASTVQRAGAASTAYRPSPCARPRSSPEPKITKRQRKTRSWGSLLSKKAKAHSFGDTIETRPSPSSPLREFAPSDESTIDDSITDEAARGMYDRSESQTQQPRIDFSNWKPRELASSYRSNNDETEPDGSILDLDAAFASPTSTNSGTGFDPSSGFSSAKRRMHSGGNTGAFVGPGMHYHRRAESAPEMAPVDYSSFGIHRLGSNPAMADVFEEDEEDDTAEKQGNTQTKSKAIANRTDLQGLGVQIMDFDDSQNRQLRRRPQIPLSRPEGTPSSESTALERSGNNLGNEVGVGDGTVVEIVDSTEEPRFSVVTKSSDESTITPTLSDDALSSGQLPNPMDFAFPAPNLHFETPETISSVSSPDMINTSFDVPRLNTATSSITDRTNWSSPRPGERGHNSTYSTEDVPSLTSSASTMISGHPSRFSSSAETRSSAERSFSVSGAVPPRTRPVSAYKRSSLASLSRLVGSSYGEKSKLSIASTAQSDEVEKKDKKKGNRISRLMRFWKSKEKLNSG